MCEGSELLSVPGLGSDPAAGLLWTRVSGTRHTHPLPNVVDPCLSSCIWAGLLSIIPERKVPFS